MCRLRLPIFCQACVELELARSRKLSLEPDLQAVGDAVGGLGAMSLGALQFARSRGYFHLPNLKCEPVCELHASYWHVRTKTQRRRVTQLQRVQKTR